MSCGSCAKEFGWFTKELGCVRCNRLFCKKCLIYKVPDDNNPKRTLLVCLRCFSLNSQQNDSSKDKKSNQKIEELLEVKPDEFVEPVLEPNSSNSDDIRNRLDLLKDDSKADENVQNIDDIQQRLANLKGVDYKPQTGTKVLFTPDARSEQEKIEDLLKQFVEEKQINDQVDVTTTSESNQPGSIDDIERRLAELRGVDVSKIKTQIPDEPVEESEQEEIDRTVMAYLEEAKLPDFVVDPDEQELISSIPSPPGNKKDLEELPFCEICNEDAVIRCLECENIFCHRCFLEFHDEEDYKTHKTKPYQAPTNNDD